MTAGSRARLTKLLPALFLLGVASATPARELSAQGPAAAARRAPQLELRGDVIAGRATSVQGALGVIAPLGIYARASLVAGAGTTWFDGRSRASGRADAIVRFLLDPFGERRWGPYGGVGVSTLFTAAGDGGERSTWRGYLLAVAGLEGPSKGGFLPSIEVGLGGGTRVGVVLRHAPAEGR